MNRILMYGGVFFGVVIMFLPVHARLVGIPVSCGTGWQAATATGATGSVCNGAGQMRGLIAVVIVVMLLFIAYLVARSSDRQAHEDALLTVLAPGQRLDYDIKVEARATSRNRFGVTRRLVMALAVLVAVLAIVIFLKFRA